MLDALFSSPAMGEIFSPRARLQAMLDFEAALAHALAEAGVMASGSATAIERACTADGFDIGQLERAAGTAGNLAIPMVAALAEAVARSDPLAAREVHRGATSQDAMDTGLVLQLRAALAVIDADLARAAEAAASLARRYRDLPVAGRTWLQHAVPLSFGFKAAGWMSAIDRDRQRLAQLAPRLLVLQFGGAAGTLDALGPQGAVVAAALARRLALGLPELAWHGHRDRLAEAASSFAIVIGNLGKIARDISLMTQSEVAELREPAAPGRGSSSAMPHKRNPVICASLLAAATRAPGLAATMLTAMTQEHERGLGNWLAEWETLPELCRLTGGAAARAAQLLAGLEVDEAAMLRNLAATGGMIHAPAIASQLAPQLGARGAHAAVEAAVARAQAGGRQLAEVVREAMACGEWPAIDLAAALDPALGAALAALAVDRALAIHAQNACHDEADGDG